MNVASSVGTVRVLVVGDIGALRPTVEASPIIEVVDAVDDVDSLRVAAHTRLAEVALLGDVRDVLTRSLVDELHEAGMSLVAAMAQPEGRERDVWLSLGVEGGVAYAAEAESAWRTLMTARTTLQRGMRTRSGWEPSWWEVDDEDASGAVIAVWGPTGAPGRSLVAAGVAGAMAKRGVETLLVDADLYGGSLAETFGLLDEAPGVLAAVRAVDRGTLSWLSLRSLTYRPMQHLRLLTGVSKPSRWPEVRPGLFEQMLRVAREHVKVVVVDCGFSLEDDDELSYDVRPPRRNGVTLTALEMADAVIAVGRHGLVNTSRLESALLDLADLGVKPSCVVHNIVPAGEMPLVTTELAALQETRRAAGMARVASAHAVHEVPFDPISVHIAAGMGIPVSALPVRSPISLAMHKVVRDLIPAGRNV